MRLRLPGRFSAFRLPAAAAAGFAGGVLALAGAGTATAGGTDPGHGSGADPGAHHPVLVSGSWSQRHAYQGDAVVLATRAKQPSVPKPSITISVTVPADVMKPAGDADCTTSPAQHTITCSSTSYQKAAFRFVVKLDGDRDVAAAIGARAATGDAGRAAATLHVHRTPSPSPSASSPSTSPSETPSGSPSAEPSTSACRSASAGPSTSPSDTASPSAAPSSPGAGGSGDGGLPVTGTSLTIIGALAALLLAAGGALLVVARRRRANR